MIKALALWTALFATDEAPPQVREISHARAVPTRPALAVGAEGSMHGFAGNGLVLSLNPTGAWSLDGGFGWSPAGLTAGLRGRLNFATGALRPFAGVGLSQSFGATRALQNGYDTFATIDVPASTYLQVIAGATYVRRSGLFLLSGVGYQRLLGHSNVRVRSGIISKEEFMSESRLLGSGLVLSLSVGYAI